MLTLARGLLQRIVIGDGPNKVTITLVEIRHRKEQALIGIEAPDHIPVHRQEVYDDIKRRGGNLLEKRKSKQRPGNMHGRTFANGKKT